MNIQGSTSVSSPVIAAKGVSPSGAVADAAAPTGGPQSGGSSSSSQGLVQTANGEYTAASVAADEKDAMALGLVIQKDGNYAPATAKTIAASKQPAATSTAAVQDALNRLILGG